MTDEKDENKLIAERRGKLDALREGGNAYPNDFRRNALAAELHQTFEAHEDETLREEHVSVSVSGRMMAKRVMGKASFVKIQDRSGQIQLRQNAFEWFHVAFVTNLFWFVCSFTRVLSTS